MAEDVAAAGVGAAGVGVAAGGVAAGGVAAAGVVAEGGDESGDQGEDLLRVVKRARPAYPHPSSAGRSANMKANRRADTKPELALRRALHRLGYRYRKDHRLDLAEGVRVRPDIVFTARKVAVFVDGCFWHCCPEHGTQPTANTWYWEPKLRRNVDRDRAADAALSEAGWTVIRFWEHEAIDAAVAGVVDVLGGGQVPDVLDRGHEAGRPPSAGAGGPPSAGAGRRPSAGAGRRPSAGAEPPQFS